MSNVTPPASAGFERLTVKVWVCVPLFPSFAEILSIARIGGALQSLIAEAELRGGVPGLSVGVVKSFALLSASVQPSFLRSAPLVADKAAVGEVSEQLADPYPTKSATVTPVGQPAVVVAVAVPTMSATLPSVELMLSKVLLASS